MPSFLTHWRVLIETARRSQDAGSDLGSLVVDNAALQRRLKGLPTPPQTTPAGAVWDTGPLPKIDYRFPGSDISAMAFLGALAPGITGYQQHAFSSKISGKLPHLLQASSPTNSQVQWERLLHTNRSGDVLLALLELIAEIPAPALRSQALAFCLGYLSHIATDIALNPWINVLANSYTRDELSGLPRTFSPHFYVELCLDEYVAATFFEHELYRWFGQPWVSYIEPIAWNTIVSSTLASQTLDLFVAAIEATYGLIEAQSRAFRRAYLRGLRHLRSYLAGRGPFLLYTLKNRLRKRTGDPIPATIAIQQRTPDTTTAEAVIAYAVRLSERLCRRAISYYASLRNTKASAEERNQRRLNLCADLHNWDLNTGYTLEVSFDQEITLRATHNWIHFADLWDDDAIHPLPLPNTST